MSIVFSAVLLILHAPAELISATFSCLQDTYIDEAYPKDNFGGSDRLLIADSKFPSRILMKYYIPEWVEISDIAAAGLVLYGAPWAGGAGGATDFEVFAMSGPWQEGTCRCANDPAEDDGASWYQYAYDPDNRTNRWNSPGGDYGNRTSVGGTLPEGNEWEKFTIDITGLLQRHFEKVREYGILIKHPQETRSGTWQNCASRESTGYDPPRHPCLDVTFVNPPQNDAPDPPAGPIPADNAEGIPVDTDLSWNCRDPNPDNQLVYDIYFGSDEELQLVSEGQTAQAFDPGLLKVATTYAWQIVARDNYGEETRGPLWHFSKTPAGILSVEPASGSPVYLNSGRYFPQPILVSIRGIGTHFRTVQSKVCLNDDALFCSGSFALSAEVLITTVIIGESARASLHDISVITGDETAVGTDLFEVQKFWRGSEQMFIQNMEETELVSL